MPRKKNLENDSKIKEKLEYLNLDLNDLPEQLEEYNEINFRISNKYDEKKYKQYRFVNISDIEILISPTNRIDSIKEKYEKAEPLYYYLDNKNPENITKHTKFLEMLSKVTIGEIEEVEEEQKNLSKRLPFKVKFTGNYLWQIYYSDISNKYFMIVPTEDSDYSTFFYLIKKKIEKNKNDNIFVPISIIDYDGKILSNNEIRDIENYLWLFTKDYPSIYEVYNKKGEMCLKIIGETYLYENIRSFYKYTLFTREEALKLYKLLKALFILQKELPHYFTFETNIDKDGNLHFFYDNEHINYSIMPEFITLQYLKSINLINKIDDEVQVLNIKLEELKKEQNDLSLEFAQKEKQITTYLECKKSFFGKVKYFFKYNGKKSANKTERMKSIEDNKEFKSNKHIDTKIEERNYTLDELEESFKELEKKEENQKSIIMDINALKLKNKNLTRKIKNATKYLEDINKHKKSIFEFWKYTNKDAVNALDEGELEELNVKSIEKVLSYDNDFENFGIKVDKAQRNKFTDDEFDSVFVANDEILNLINKINLNLAENKDISIVLKELKTKYEKEDLEKDETFNIFGKFNPTSIKEYSLGNKTHREQPRNIYQVLGIKKETKGSELKRTLEKVLKNIQSALGKNILEENIYIYKVSSEPLDLNTIQRVSLNAEYEMEDFFKNNDSISKLYFYKIKIPKGTNFVAFSNIIFFDNKNMTLPVGMNLSSNILLDFSKLKYLDKGKKKINRLQFMNKEDDFTDFMIKHILVRELEAKV